MVAETEAPESSDGQCSGTNDQMKRLTNVNSHPMRSLNIRGFSR